MLVKNDFLSHWKTRLLCKRIGDGPALRALLSLWSYCEQRRAWQFCLTPLELAGVCDFGGEQVDLYHHLLELRFIVEVENGFWEVNGWGEMNASLVAKWPGRHLKKGEFYHPQGRIAEAIAQPIAPPIPTPIAPAIAQAIGLDRIGLDRKEPPVVPQGGRLTEPPAALSQPDSPSPVPNTPTGTSPIIRDSEEAAPGKKKKGGAAALAECLAIYAAYPRHVGRDKACKAIAGALARSGLESGALLARVRAYAEAVAKWPPADRDYIPHPATWFNQGRYADDPREWQRNTPPAGQRPDFGGQREVAIEEQSLLNVDAADFEPEGWRDVWPEITDAPLPREFADVPPALRARLIDECEKREGGEL